jgi:DNA-binding protein Fis
MSQAIKQRKKKPNLSISGQVRMDEIVRRNKIQLLQTKLLESLRELDSLDQAPIEDTGQRLDFYSEVSQFEIELIKRALRLANGNQCRAARLLNLKTTTLNAMVRRYYFQLGQVVLWPSVVMKCEKGRLQEQDIPEQFSNSRSGRKSNSSIKENIPNSDRLLPVKDVSVTKPKTS